MKVRDVDVLVLGGGAAGLVAAAAARGADRSVLVVSKAAGATSMSSGAVDVADVDRAVAPSSGDPLAPTDIAASMEALARARPHHPYAVIGAAGRARVDEALAFFGALAATVPLTKRADGRNLVVATVLGTVKRTAMAAGAADLAALAADARLGVLEPADLAGFDAVDVERTLSFLLGAGGRALALVRVPVARALTGPCAQDPSLLARRLDEEPEARALFIDHVHEAVERASPRPTLLVAPPGLGLEQATTLRRQLGERTALPVVELLGLPPSPPGLRLQRALELGCEERGAERETGVAHRAVVEGRRVKSVALELDGEPVTVRPGAVVLATGRFLAGGVTREGRIAEALFGVPVFDDARPIDDRFAGELTADRPGGDHAIFRAGVRVDAELCPLDREGAVFARNLFAAGSILGGYDPARDGSGLGLCALTGLLAGERAARAVDGTAGVR